MAKFIVTVAAGGSTRNEEFEADRLLDTGEGGRWVELREDLGGGKTQLIVRFRADDVRRVRREE